MDKPRIAVAGTQLATVIMVWLRHAPKWVWGKDPAYERLRAQKRNDPNEEPDAQREVANFLAAEIGRLGWEVSYGERDSFVDSTSGPPRLRDKADSQSDDDEGCKHS